MPNRACPLVLVLPQAIRRRACRYRHRRVGWLRRAGILRVGRAGVGIQIRLRRPIVARRNIRVIISRRRRLDDEIIDCLRRLDDRVSVHVGDYLLIQVIDHLPLVARRQSAMCLQQIRVLQVTRPDGRLQPVVLDPQLLENRLEPKRLDRGDHLLARRHGCQQTVCLGHLPRLLVAMDPVVSPDNRLQRLRVFQRLASDGSDHERLLRLKKDTQPKVAPLVGVGNSRGISRPRDLLDQRLLQLHRLLVGSEKSLDMQRLRSRFHDFVHDLPMISVVRTNRQF